MNNNSKFDSIKKEISADERQIKKININLKEIAGNNKKWIFSAIILIIFVIIGFIGNSALTNLVIEKNKEVVQKYDDLKKLGNTEKIDEVNKNISEITTFNKDRRELTMLEIYSFLSRVIPSGNLSDKIKISRGENDFTFMIKNVDNTFKIIRTLDVFQKKGYIVSYDFKKVSGKTKNDIDYTYSVKIKYRVDDNLRKFFKEEVKDDFFVNKLTKILDNFSSVSEESNTLNDNK